MSTRARCLVRGAPHGCDVCSAYTRALTVYPRWSGPGAALVLDAATIDVYKQTQCAVLMYDPSKRWTFEHVNRLVEGVPGDIPILVLVCARWLRARRGGPVETERLTVVGSGKLSRCSGHAPGPALGRRGLGRGTRPAPRRRLLCRMLHARWVWTQVHPSLPQRALSAPAGTTRPTTHGAGLLARAEIYRRPSQRTILERQLADNQRELSTTAAELELATATPDQDYAQYGHGRLTLFVCVRLNHGVVHSGSKRWWRPPLRPRQVPRHPTCRCRCQRLHPRQQTVPRRPCPMSHPPRAQRPPSPPQQRLRPRSQRLLCLQPPRLRVPVPLLARARPRQLLCRPTPSPSPRRRTKRRALLCPKPSRPLPRHARPQPPWRVR
jgi:hypothetical protein